jgi:carbonic anhydrase
MITTREALLRLREGNARFAADDPKYEPRHYRARREQLVSGQEPFAVVVGCSDSRVPVEIVFDQGLGDLFVIRVAGNVISATQLASIEFAVEKYGTRLVVVLGHRGCGAMEAAIMSERDGRKPASDELRALVEEIGQVVRRVVDGGCGSEAATLADLAGREYVRHAVDSIRNGSDTIRRLVEDNELAVVGAEYSLASGLVEFF